MALGIQEEGALLEDGGLGFPPRAREHEFRELLSAQGSCAAEHRLELGRSPDLDDIILARRGASVGTGVLCHVAKLLTDIWQFATTMSIHSHSPRQRLQVASLAIIAMLAGPQSASAQTRSFGGASKQRTDARRGGKEGVSTCRTGKTQKN